MELRAEGIYKEVKRSVKRLKDSIKIVKLTQAVIKLESKFDRACNKKRSLKGALNLQ